MTRHKMPSDASPPSARHISADTVFTRHCRHGAEKRLIYAVFLRDACTFFIRHVTRHGNRHGHEYRF